MPRHFQNFAPFALAAFMAASPAMAEPRSFETPRTDGSAIYWTLDVPDSEGTSGLVVIAQGSGCAAAMQSPNLGLARSIFGNLAALTVEKYGVEPGDNPSDDHMDCSQVFREHHTVSQRVADYRQIIDSLRDAACWNGKLGLFGGSEGGIVMAMLAPEVRADAAILISTGGGVPFGQMVRQSIPEEGWPTVDATFERARENPDSTEWWGGQSLRFWADAIDRRAADYMLRADTNFLLIQGGRDGAGAANVARAVGDLFANAGRCNLTYWEFPAFDHGMIDANGNAHLAEVLSQASLWLDSRMAANATTTCTTQ